MIWEADNIIVNTSLDLLAAVLARHVANVVATRFVKCNKCNHFFAVIPDSETKLHVKESGNDARQQTERRPPPPPRKVCHHLACVSSYERRLWHCSLLRLFILFVT